MIAQKHLNLNKVSPFLRHTKKVIDSFLDDYAPDWSYHEEQSTMQFQFPRCTGSTLLAHIIAHERQAIVVTPTSSQKEHFKKEQQDLFPEDNLILILSCHSLKNIGLHDIDFLLEIHKAAQKTKTIVMDVFRAYSNNSGIKRFSRDFRNTHKFIVFR